MKKILFFSIIIFLAACKKTPTEDTPSVVAPMEIKSIVGYTDKGDTVSSCKTKTLGYYFADNELHINGSNFGDEDGEIEYKHPQITASLLSWSPSEIVINTDIDSWATEIKDPLSITLKRADGKTLETPKLNFVNDIEGFPMFTPTWFLYSVLQGRTTVLPNDFYQNMEACDSGYEPELHDIVMMADGKYGIITTTPTSTANAFYREWTFQISYMDCTANEIEVIGKFKVTSDVVQVTSQTPAKYFKV